MNENEENVEEVDKDGMRRIDDEMYLVSSSF